MVFPSWRLLSKPRFKFSNCWKSMSVYELRWTKVVQESKLLFDQFNRCRQSFESCSPVQQVPHMMKLRHRCLWNPHIDVHEIPHRGLWNDTSKSMKNHFDVFETLHRCLWNPNLCPWNPWIMNIIKFLYVNYEHIGSFADQINNLFLSF